MQPAMHIRVVVLVKIPQRLDHGARFLRGRSAIEIDQRMSVRLLAQNREIFAKRTPVDSAGSDLVHITICYTCRRAPVYSQRATKPWCRSGGRSGDRRTVAASLCEASRVRPQGDGYRTNV